MLVACLITSFSPYNQHSKPKNSTKSVLNKNCFGVRTLSLRGQYIKPFSSLTRVCTREYLMYYRGPEVLAVVWLGSPPPVLLLGEGGWGGERSQII
jgi:hypothetical protein